MISTLLLNPVKNVNTGPAATRRGRPCVVSLSSISERRRRSDGPGLRPSSPPRFVRHPWRSLQANGIGSNRQYVGLSRGTGHSTRSLSPQPPHFQHRCTALHVQLHVAGFCEAGRSLPSGRPVPPHSCACVGFRVAGAFCPDDTERSPRSSMRSDFLMETRVQLIVGETGYLTHAASSTTAHPRPAGSCAPRNPPPSGRR